MSKNAVSAAIKITEKNTKANETSPCRYEMKISLPLTKTALKRAVFGYVAFKFEERKN